MFHPFSPMCIHSQVSYREKLLSSPGSQNSSLLLLASGAGEGVGDALTSVAEGILSILHDALALAGGVVAARACGIADLLGGRLVALCCGVSRCGWRRNV